MFNRGQFDIYDNKLPLGRYEKSNYSTYNSGNIKIVQEENILKVTVNNYDFNGIFPYYIASYNSAPDNVRYKIYTDNIGTFSVGYMQIFVPDNEASTIKDRNYYLTISDSNVNIVSLTDKRITSQAYIGDDNITINHVLYKEGSYSQEFQIFGNGRLESAAGKGDAKANLGDNINIRTKFIMASSNDYDIQSADKFIKFDGEAFEPRYNYDGTRYGMDGGNFDGTATFKIMYVTKKDGTNWTSQSEMNYANIDDMDIYENIEDIPNNKICIGVFAETIDGYIARSSGTNNAILIPLKVKKTATVGKTYGITGRTRMWIEKLDRNIYTITNKSVEYPTPTWDSGNKNYIKTEYDKNGNIISGTHSGGAQWGNTVLVVGANLHGNIKAIDSSNSNKVNYDLGKNENVVTYSVQSQLDKNSNLSSQISNVTLKAEVTIPKGLEYVPGSSKRGGSTYTEPEITENSDGSQKLVWYIYGVTSGQTITPITFDANIDNESSNGTQYEAKFVVSEVIGSDGISKIGNSKIDFRTSTTSINIINLESHRLYKEVETPIIEKNGEIKYKVTYENKTDATVPDFQLLDVLPYNGDGRGSSFSGSYTLKNISVTQTVNGSNSGLDNLKIYSTNSDNVKGMDAKNTGIGTDSIWENISNGNVNKASKGIAIKGELAGKAKIELEITLASNGNNAKDVYTNTAMAQVYSNSEQMETSRVYSRVVNRYIEGKVWLDNNYNGVIDDEERYLNNVTLKLINTANGSQVATTTTNENGEYKFTDVAKGKYKVQIEVNGTYYDLTEKEVGTNVEINSKFNTDSAETDQITRLDSIQSPELIETNVNAGLTIKKINIPVTKVWNDNADAAKKRPDGIIAVIKNGTAEVGRQELNDGNSWRYTFTGLPKYTENLQEINYTLEEQAKNTDDLKFYDGATSGSKDSGFTITNTFTVPDERTSVTVTKIWDDNGNINKKRSNSVTMVLAGTGEGVNSSYEQQLTISNVDPNNPNNWVYTFNNLPKLDNFGNEIQYTVDEKDLGNKFYTKGNIDQSAKTVTNVSVYGKVTVHHYIMESDGTTTETRVPSADGGEVQDELIEGAQGEGYTTNAADNIQPNYELAQTPANANGTIAKDPTEVIYYYKLKDPTITNSEIDKNSTLAKVTEKGQAVPYSITYSTNVDTYIGDAEVTIVDTLPYEIVEESSNLDGGTYEATSKTITWKENITGINTFTNTRNQINVTKNISLVYKDLDVTKANVSNKVTGTINLKTPDKTDTTEDTKDIPTEFLKDVKVTKLWNDNGNSRNKRPNSVTLVLTGNGQTYKQSVSIADEVQENSNNWEYTFRNLPKYDDEGNEIDYQVSEERSAEENNKFYTESIDQGNKIITNTFTVPDEKVTVTAKKYWDDNNNEAQKRPTSATLTLTGTGAGVNVSKEQEVTSEINAVVGDANTWEYTFTDLPKYDDNGDEVVYTINEKDLNNEFYIKSNVDQETRTVTNTFQVPGDKVDVTVTKVWDDNSNGTRKRPTSVTLQVKNGNIVVASEAVTEADSVDGDTNRWSHTFSVPKYDASGNEIKYTADELDTGSIFYTIANKNISGSMAEGYTITNKFVVPDERISIPVTKVWDDNSNSAGKRPESVTLVLTGNGQEYKQELTAVVNADSSNQNNWIYTFNDLPKLDENGDEINYVLSEELSNIYYTAENSKVDQNAKTVSNTFKVPTDTIEIPVVKVWDDNNNTANKRPDNVVLVLTGNDGSAPNKITLGGQYADPDDGNRWLYTFKNLPKYNAVNGDEIVYTLSEENLNNKFYTTANTVVSQETMTVTNKFEVPDEKVSIPVTKVWNDNSNKAGKRPNSVTISVSGNGRTEKTTLNIGNVVDDSNTWEYTFTDLPKYDANGDEIKYTIAEEQSDEENNKFYQSSISQSTYTVTNTFDVPDETVSIPVKKVWDDNSNKANKRPSSVTLTLTGTGAGVNVSKEQEITVSDDSDGDPNTWEYTFADLPKYDDNGDEVVYTIDEKNVDSIFYVKSNVEQDSKTITNTFRVPGDTIEIPVVKVWDDNNNIAGKRPTSIDLVLNGSDGSGPYRQTLTDADKDSTDSNKWTYTFRDLPKYNQNTGDEITYTLSEENVNSDFYVASIDQGSKTVTNTFQVPNETINIPVTKIWNDSNNANGRRPDSVTLTLTGTGQGVNINKEQVVTEKDAVTGNSNAWQYRFDDLPIYDDYGDEIVYTINEKNPGNEFYIKSDVDQETRTVTNTFQVPGDKVDITVTKIWNDNGDIAGKRPAVVTLQVKNGEILVASEAVTEADSVDGDTNRWSHTFSVPKYDSQGQEINYTVDEAEITNKFYTKENVNQTDRTITNKFVVPDEKTSVTVTKIWDDKNNLANKRPTSVTMKLTGTGEGVNSSYEQVLTAEANADPSNANNWVYTFNDLPKLDNYGNEIKYTVDEEDLGNKFYSKGTVDQTAMTVTNVSEYGKVIVHHYIMDTNGTTTTTRVPSADGGEVQDETIEGAQGEEYSTNPAENIQSNYELVAEKLPANATGTIAENDTEVIYYYRLKTPTVTNNVTKTGTDRITSANQEVSYTITYNANLTDYIGNAEVTIVDTLPYVIDEAKI